MSYDVDNHGGIICASRRLSSANLAPVRRASRAIAHA